MAYGEDYYDGDTPRSEMEFTEYLFRLDNLIEEWFAVLRLYNHPEQPFDPAVASMHRAWAEYRLEETSRDFAAYLEDRRLQRSSEEREAERLEEMERGGTPDSLRVGAPG